MIAIWEMRFRNFQILLIHVLFTWTQSRNIFESCIVRLKSHNVTWLNPITNQMTKKNIYRSISHICIDTPAADKIITEPPLPQQLGVSNKRYSHSYNGRGKATSAGASESDEIRASGFRCMSSWNVQAENICWPVLYMSDKTVSALTSYKSFLSLASLEFLWVQWWTMIHDLVKR